MSTSVTVRNASAVGSKSLCRTCRYAHIVLGYSENEEETRCAYFYEKPRLVPFPVRECTDYFSKLSPTLGELENIAVVIGVKATPRAGFVTAVSVSDCEDDSE
jgi:hypothetical protein